MNEKAQNYQKEQVLAIVACPPKPPPALMQAHPQHEYLGRLRDMEILAARKEICMWLLWKLLQSGSACSTGVKKEEVIVLHLVGMLCMTQA